MSGAGSPAAPRGCRGRSAAQREGRAVGQQRQEGDGGNQAAAPPSRPGVKPKCACALPGRAEAAPDGASPAEDQAKEENENFLGVP